MVEKKDFILKAEPSASADGQPSERQDSQTPEAAQLPKITFSTFILSLNASALVNLGVIEDPATSRKIKNLAFGQTNH